jgi:hypothetical protein
MKIVDQTPFYKENGELSVFDRGKAILQFGPGWFKDIEAQKSVIAVLKKNLDKNYTLLCNIIPPGLDARIPLILVGPTGVYVMTVTPKIGMFRARGDQWGYVSGSTFRPENPNLLTLTEKMSRAIQVYLQRQGYADLSNVEAALLCSDPATTVDTMRPIIRVIMRDSLERFAASVMQARIVLNPESAFDIVNRLLTPPPPPPSKPDEVAETAAPEPTASPSAQPGDPYVPAFAMPGSAPSPASLVEPASPGTGVLPQVAPSAAARPRSRRGLTTKQITLLAGMAVIWLIIIVAIIILIAMNMNPPLLMFK